VIYNTCDGEDDDDLQKRISKGISSFLSSDSAVSMFSTLIQTALTNAILPVTTEISRLSIDVEKIKSENNLLSKSLEKTQRELSEAKKYVDIVEQNSKKSSMIIFSSAFAEDGREDVCDLVTSYCRSTLQMSSALEIIDCYRIGKRSRDTASASVHRPLSRPILVIFTSPHTKMKVMDSARRAKTGLHHPPVFFSDDLTKVRRNIFSNARQLKKEKRIGDCWVRHGNIYVKSFDGKITMFDSEDAFTSFSINLPVGSDLVGS